MDRWRRRFSWLIGSSLIAGIIVFFVPPDDHFPERQLFKLSAPINEQIAIAGVWSLITGSTTQYLVGYELQPDSQVTLQKGIAYYDSELRKRGFGPKHAISSNTAVWTKGSRQILLSDFSASPNSQTLSTVEVYDMRTTLGERMWYLIFKRR